MKILIVSDEECPGLWDYYTPDKLRDFQLILSCGDLKPKYLEFLVTMAHCPLLYVHGNHDSHYDRNPPEGCYSIDDGLVVYNGIRILGLGGCMQYHPGPHQYTDRAMRRRIRRLRWKLWRLGGVDIVVTHAPPAGLGDAEDYAHRGFPALRDLLDKYHPAYLVHGHVHLTYGQNMQREISYNGTCIVNGYERYALEIPDKDVPLKMWNTLIWKTRDPNWKDPFEMEMEF